MNLNLFPKNIRPYLIPEVKGEMIYQCLGCNQEWEIRRLLYTCPECGSVLLLYDRQFDRIKKIPPNLWRKIFDYRKMITIPALKGIYRFHEFIGPVIPLNAVVYLGEGHTPIIEANDFMKTRAGITFFFKNDGQNPSASFKDRGMASALSYLLFLLKKGHVKDVLAICASTGDTSASAALYASYLQPHVKSAVLLPHQKVTPQQLSQPLGSGAVVFEIPGVFDDCMKVVEHLSSRYAVALLNSKNAWRILGQESYSYEIAQDFEYDMTGKAVVVPIGNAGNITALLSGFLKFHNAGIIKTLPKIIGVQSDHADPVFQYYREPNLEARRFVPVKVKPSVAQAAMIGNPVSMPRVIHLVNLYNTFFEEKQGVYFVQVSEQEIMDWQLLANRNGHIACTQGGESLAGLVRAVEEGYVDKNEIAVVDSTAHALKFSGFQELYFRNGFPSDFEITPKTELINSPILVPSRESNTISESGNIAHENAIPSFIEHVSNEIANQLNLKKTAKP